MQTCVFLDLDDTIFQTAHKCPIEGSRRPVAFGRDGRALSFMTPSQELLFDLLRASGRLIPTTARNLDAFRRVTLPFDDLAILNFGGVVLNAEGMPNQEWDDIIRPQLIAQREEIDELAVGLDQINESRQLGASVRVVNDFGMHLYVVAKHPASDLQALAELRAASAAICDGSRFFTHSNHNNLSFVPRSLGKERAVAFVIERLLGPDVLTTIGVGDSVTDGAFMRLCDYHIIPKGSQLAVVLDAEEA